MSDETLLSSASQIQTVTVLGAGTMGHGIAQVCALAGYSTRLFDVDPDALTRGLAAIEANLKKGIERGKTSEPQRDAALAKLSTCSELPDACRDCQLVIEAVPERLDLKHAVLQTAAQHAARGAILATNTSSLSIAAITRDLPDPQRVIGTHFFNPVHVMKLLEIVVGPSTSQTVVSIIREFGSRIGKECITIRDSPGFATSRLGLVIGLEAIRMVEQGVGSAEDIDKAMTLGYGFPMGPLRLTDLVGLDVRLHIAEYLAQNLQPGAHFEPPALLRKMVAEGKLGKKTGEGFYRW